MKNISKNSMVKFLQNVWSIQLIFVPLYPQLKLIKSY